MFSQCYFAFYLHLFFFMQKTAYEMRISDWSSDVCSSDLVVFGAAGEDLDGTADFFVAAADRVQLAVSRGFGKVTREFLQGVIAILGACCVGSAASAPFVDSGVQRLCLVARRSARRYVERRDGKESVSTCSYRGWPT